MTNTGPTMMEYADPKRHRPPTPLLLRLMLAFAAWLGWAMLGFVGVGAIVGASMMIGLGPMIGFLFGVALLAVIVISAACAVAYRRRTAALLVGYLEQAVRLNLPLAPLLAAVERGESESLRPRVAALRVTLEQGAPVGEALQTAAPGADRRTVELLNAAERSGALPLALARLYRDELRTADAEGTPGRGAAVGAYALAVAFAQACLILLIAVFVMPKYEQIFKDFRIQMPDLTRLTMRATGTFGIPVALVAGVGVVWMTSRSLRQLLRQRPARDPAQDLWDRAVWVTPIAGRLARDRGLADAL